MLGLAWLTPTILKWSAIALAVVVLTGGAAYVKHEWDAGQKARVQVQAARAINTRVTHAVATSDHAAATAEVKAQERIVVRTRTLRERIPVYVPVNAPCIPWGVVRLHDAAVLHLDPGSLQPPAGQPDDACSDVAPRAFVDAVVANYGTADANAEQLNALEANLAERAAAVAAEAPPF